MSALKLYGGLTFTGFPSAFDPQVLESCEFQPEREAAFKKWLNEHGRLEVVSTLTIRRDGRVTITFYDYGLNFDPAHNDFRLARVLEGVTVHMFHRGRLEFHDPNKTFKGFSALIADSEMTSTWLLERVPRDQDPFPTRCVISIEASQQPDHSDASTFLGRFEAGLLHFMTEGVPPKTMKVTSFAW